MRLKTLIPSGIIVDEEIDRIRFEAKNGSYTFFPNHADFITAIIPGIVSYNLRSENGKETFMACDQGILVKEGNTVLLSVRRAIKNDDLNVLVRAIDEEFKKVEEERKTVNAAMARLEVGLTRGLMQLNSNH